MPRQGRVTALVWMYMMERDSDRKRASVILASHTSQKEAEGISQEEWLKPFFHPSKNNFFFWHKRHHRVTSLSLKLENLNLAAAARTDSAASCGCSSGLALRRCMYSRQWISLQIKSLRFALKRHLQSSSCASFHPDSFFICGVSSLPVWCLLYCRSIVVCAVDQDFHCGAAGGWLLSL